MSSGWRSEQVVEVINDLEAQMKIMTDEGVVSDRATALNPIPLARAVYMIRSMFDELKFGSGKMREFEELNKGLREKIVELQSARKGKEG